MYKTFILSLASALFLGEFQSYIWHRFSHIENTINNKTHSIHHKSNVDDTAIEDFKVVLILFISTIMILYKIIKNKEIFRGLFVGLFAVLASDYVLHSAYHTEDHFLNNFEWFKKRKTEHFLHHKYPKTNYGITNSFFDKFFGTFKETQL